LAAQIEMFGLSKRELEEKFKKSEMVVLAWRSQEISANMEKQSEGMMSPGKSRKPVYDAEVPHNLPDHFFNEDGEIDLRQVTGEEAYKYMSSIGVKLPRIMPFRRDK
jgi:hypothetical protein